MKRVSCAFFALLLLFCLPLGIRAKVGEQHWYCTRQKAHKQALCAPELRFVEEHGGYYIDHKVNEGSEDKVVYLTFDAGYENGNVETILNVLKEKEVPGAFFILKHLVDANTDLVQRMANEGHLVCNHTANHPNLAHASKEKIETEVKALEEACRAANVPVAPYFRPPEGTFSKEMLDHVRSLGYKTVFWSFAYADWDNDRQMAQDAALRCVLDNHHNGAVLLLHPTSKTNALILPRVIDELKKEGYRFGTLDELCA